MTKEERVSRARVLLKEFGYTQAEALADKRLIKIVGALVSVEAKAKTLAIELEALDAMPREQAKDAYFPDDVLLGSSWAKRLHITQERLNDVPEFRDLLTAKLNSDVFIRKLLAPQETKVWQTNPIPPNPQPPSPNHQ